MNSTVTTTHTFVCCAEGEADRGGHVGAIQHIHVLDRRALRGVAVSAASTRAGEERRSLA